MNSPLMPACSVGSTQRILAPGNTPRSASGWFGYIQNLLIALEARDVFQFQARTKDLVERLSRQRVPFARADRHNFCAAR
jgi:hypothetical protein